MIMIFIFTSCSEQDKERASDQSVLTSAAGESVSTSTTKEKENESQPFTVDTAISEVMNYPAFGDWGRLIFPVNSSYYSGETLGNLRLTWYNNIDPQKTVEIANYMREHADRGEMIFYDIYTDEEKAADPAKADTGLFFFKGEPNGKFAVCNAGGGFAYVGAMHDSFPHALELSKWATTPLRSSTVRVGIPPARIWRERSALFLQTLRSLK